MPPTAPKAETRNRWNASAAPAAAVAGLLLAWVPGLGVLVSAVGLVLGLRRPRGEGRVRGWTIALSIVGLVLGLAFTAASLFLLPRGIPPADGAGFERFEEWFEAEEPQGGSDRP